MDRTKLDLPSTTQQPIIHVDATPDEGLPLKILRAYRENCNVRWEVHGLDEERSRVYDLMNDDCERRAEILDKAIALLAKGVVD